MGRRRIILYTLCYSGEIAMTRPSRDRRSFFNWRYVKTERRVKNRQWALLLVLSIPLFLLFERHVFSTGIVTDVSMLPTLREGGYFLIHKYPCLFGPPRRGDIVVLRSPQNRRWRYVKRVIGLEGETLSVRAGKVWVNGSPLNEPYATGETFPDWGPQRIPPGHYFVLGDNRENSEDSRAFGSVPRRMIEGKISACASR